ncbi:Cobyrinic acid ac-diamide synthase [Ammonifex degensii KC4]|uniref:Cobyrinic acid ac-diamide synthase n=1 Tax=Ammonifex degensii (strain DSM 10501 / KC4) TaxID=429009 RepID=C9R9X6_AMMDK|nr:MinD/ParA family protein [Ammonifex degensii]ACX53105.1 Cobyrinic acid ac-diamide synthase [Ammonifex degensii KC4]
MRDQAYKLKMLVNQKATSRSRVLAITSGKGGVGKTSLAVNLGILLAQRGKRVVLFDADLGLANAEVLLGVTPACTLYDYLYRGKRVEELINTGPGGLKFISGGSGIEELAQLDARGRARLLALLPYLQEQTDFLLVDTGAGIAEGVLSFVAAAEEVLLVLTPEPTSLTDAYALLKVLHRREIHPRVFLVVNRAGGAKEAEQTSLRLRAVCRHFLGWEPGYLGFLPEDRGMVQAAKEQRPLVLRFPFSPIVRQLEKIADELEGRKTSGKGVEQFFHRLAQLLFS